MEPRSSDGEEDPFERFGIDLMPSELFLKFRTETRGLRVGLNLEFYNAPCNDFRGKLVLKPLSQERKWKFIYEPIHQEVRLLSKKIPVTDFLSLQVGIGHNFQLNAMNYKWTLNTGLGGDGFSRIRNKTSLGLFPGFGLRFGWRADYVLPEITGALGTSDPLFNVESGRFQASLDRVEAIVTHMPTSVFSVKEQGQYNRNFVNHVRTAIGTPRRPEKTVDRIIFGMFNENQNPEGEEQNWGLFDPDMQPRNPSPYVQLEWFHQGVVIFAAGRSAGRRTTAKADPSIRP